MEFNSGFKGLIFVHCTPHCLEYKLKSRCTRRCNK